MVLLTGASVRACKTPPNIVQAAGASMCGGSAHPGYCCLYDVGWCSAYELRITNCTVMYCTVQVLHVAHPGPPPPPPPLPKLTRPCPSSAPWPRWRRPARACQAARCARSRSWPTHACLMRCPGRRVAARVPACLSWPPCGRRPWRRRGTGGRCRGTGKSRGRCRGTGGSMIKLIIYYHSYNYNYLCIFRAPR